MAMGGEELMAEGGRDAVALLTAFLARDEAGIDVILSAADLPVLAMTLAGMLVGLMEKTGLDPAACVEATRGRALRH